MNPSTGSASTKKADSELYGPHRQAADPARLSANAGPGGEEAARSPDADRSRENCQLWPFYCSLVAFRRRAQLVPARVLSAQPRLLAVGACLLVGLGLAIYFFRTGAGSAPPDQAEPEIVLRSDPPSPNLELYRTPEPEVSAHPTEPVFSPPESVLTLPVEEPVVVPVAPELPVPIPDLKVEPAVALQRDPEPAIHVQTQRGDSPMIKNWKMLGMQTLLAGSLLASAQARAQEKDKAPVEPNKDDVIIKQLKELKLSIDALKVGMDKLQTEGSDASLKMKKIEGDIGVLTKEVELLKMQLDDLKKQPPTQIASKYGPNEAKKVDGLGRVLIVNTYGQDMTVVVNGRAYTVPANDFRFTEPVPAGNFSYEVLGVQARRDRALAVNETFTIKIHPSVY